MCGWMYMMKMNCLFSFVAECETSLWAQSVKAHWWTDGANVDKSGEAGSSLSEMFLIYPPLSATLTSCYSMFSTENMKTKFFVSQLQPSVDQHKTEDNENMITLPCPTEVNNCAENLHNTQRVDKKMIIQTILILFIFSLLQGSALFEDWGKFSFISPQWSLSSLSGCEYHPQSNQMPRCRPPVSF